MVNLYSKILYCPYNGHKKERQTWTTTMTSSWKINLNLIKPLTSWQEIQRTKEHVEKSTGLQSANIEDEGNSTRQSSGFPQLNYKKNQKKERKMYVLKLTGCTFGQDGVTETTFTLPLKKKSKQTMVSRQQTSSNKWQWSLKDGKQEMSPTTAPAYLREFPGHETRRVK